MGSTQSTWGRHLPFTMATLLTLLVPLASVMLTDAHPFLGIYTLTDGAGAWINLTDYVHDMNVVGFNAMVKSVCGRGVWLLYEDKNYNEGWNDFSHWTDMFVSGERSCH